MRYIFTIFLLNLSLFSFSFDQRVKGSDNILLTSHYEVPYIFGYSLLATALIEGNSETRFGETTFKALDSFILTNLTVEVMKKSFGRVRPRYTDDSGEWFSGGDSFPSGHVGSVTATVVPYILEYQKDTPWVHLLWLFPIQQMAGRVNVRAHWQTDVLTGFLVGGLIGWYSHSREKPLILYFDSDGIYTGLRYRF
jgi:membrane-associated phospholipid phosphatase